MVKLYEHPLSPYAQKVKIALAEKGVPFEAEIPPLAGGDLGQFRALNPRLEVPTLIDDDTAVFDSTVILEYIEDRWPTPPLLPKTPAERARVRMLEDVCDTYYEAINWACFEINVFKRAEGGLAERLLGRAAEQTASVHTWLEQQLGSRTFFNGDAFGWGDLSVVPHVQASALVGHAPPDGSRLAAWLDRVRTRPSVAAVVEAAAASMGGFEMLPRLLAARFDVPVPEIAAPPRLEELRLPAPRLQPPAALAALVSDAPHDRAAHTYGKSFRDVVRALRREFSHAPDLVAFPRIEDDVRALLDWAATAGAAVIPYGGGSSVVGGVEADVGDRYRGAVSLDLSRLDRVLEVDRASRAARIQAGVLGPALEEQLRPHGLTLRHFPQSLDRKSTRLNSSH